jgi:hypothetical protein
MGQTTEEQKPPSKILCGVISWVISTSLASEIPDAAPSI